MTYYRDLREHRQRRMARTRSTNEQPWLLESTPSSSSATGLASLKDINWRQWLDRVGGVDGLFQRMTQVQKIMQTVQQFMPMLKMFSGSLLSKPALRTTDDESFEPELSRPTRRLRRKKGVLAIRKKRRRHY